MRSLALIGLVVALLAVTAVASPWVYWGLTALLEQPFTFKRVWNRVFEVLLVVGCLAMWRRLDLGGAAEIGLRARGWAGHLGTGLVAGTAGVAVALSLAWLGGALDPALRYPAAKTVRKALLGLGAAGLVGVFEEAVFRGVVLRRLVRDAGRPLGIAVTTLIYAAVHEIGHQGRTDAVDAWSGMARLEVLFAPLASPAALPALAGLAALGLALASARLRTGNLWVAIGAHAMWVAAFRVGRLFFAIRAEPAWLVGPGWPPLVGGIAGWLGIATTAWLLRRRG